jgi:hypothetical protein
VRLRNADRLFHRLRSAHHDPVAGFHDVAPHDGVLPGGVHWDEKPDHAVMRRDAGLNHGQQGPSPDAMAPSVRMRRAEPHLALAQTDGRAPVTAHGPACVPWIEPRTSRHADPPR